MSRISFLLFLLCSCSARQQVDARSQGDWQRCRNSIVESQCGRSSDRLVDALTCERPLAEAYADTPRQMRKGWLKRHGCPPYIVGEEPQREQQSAEELEAEKARLRKQLSTAD